MKTDQIFMSLNLRFFVLICLMVSPALSVKEVILNPYHDVDWTRCGRHMANLHTHTTQSDGSLSPSAVIDNYHDQGYKVLAITDHNKYTWPWSEWDRESSELGMVAIPGTEASRHDHMNSFFCDYNGSHSNIEQSLNTVQATGGIAQINHPGRYNRSTQWYVDLYSEYDILFGMEVYNQGDRYSDDRELWDNVLTQMMPNRPVWGTSCDDMHRQGHFFRNWQVLLTPQAELTDASIRATLESGAFYIVYDPSQSQQSTIALDSLIVVNDSIHVFADCEPDKISWISEGAQVATGASLCLSSTSELGNYVRAEILGVSNAKTLLQPIGLGNVTSILNRASHRISTQLADILPSKSNQLQLTSHARTIAITLTTLSGRTQHARSLAPYSSAHIQLESTFATCILTVKSEAVTERHLIVTGITP